MTRSKVSAIQSKVLQDFFLRIAADHSISAEVTEKLKVELAEEKWPKAEVQVYDSSESADLDMTAGRLDARFDDFIVLQSGILKSDSAADYERVGNVWGEKDFGSKGEGIGVRKGETELKDAISKAILDMRADGTYKTINDKYFDFDIYGQ